MMLRGTMQTSHSGCISLVLSLHIHLLITRTDLEMSQSKTYKI